MSQSAIIGMLLAATAAPVFAQHAAPSADETTEAEEIVVTGTRLRTRNADTPTPVLRQDAEDLLRAQPLGIAEALIELPQFSGSVSPRARQGNPTDGRGNFLNLRNVGTNRTLILLDGERLPPTTVGGLVDVDVIPELLVKRVDVATSGVSAVYGSDAVTGVVNYILDPKFAGLVARAQSGISGHGDAHIFKIGAAGGFAFAADRGHVTLSLDYSDSGDVPLQDRKLGRRNILAVGLSTAAPPGTAANPYIFANDTRSSLLTPGGRVITGPFAVLGQQFAPDGRAIPFDPGMFAGPTTQIGGSGQAFPGNRTLVTGGESKRAYARLGYDLTNSLEASAEGLFSDNRAGLISGTNFVIAPIFADNAFLRPEVRAALNDPIALPFGFDPASAFVCGNGAPATACVVRIGSDLAVPRSGLSDRSYSLKAKLRGELGGSWSFSAAYIHGRTRQRLVSFNEFVNTNLFAALDAVRAPSGQIVCRVALTNPGLYPGCVPFNPFGFGANEANRAAVEGYILGSPRIRVVNRTDDVVFNVTGELGETWAGPIRVALGAEYREGALSRTSNSDPSVAQMRTGIRGIAPNAPPFIITNVGTAKGSADVKEANFEIELPLARDESFAHALSLTGAARYTDYSTSGGVTTWKIGGKWEPVPGFLIRAARSRDIRAPTLFDLFAGGTSQRAALLDVHCNCQPPTGIDVVGGGNPDLEPEKADSLAFGVAVRPERIRGLTASVDYYDLKIRDAITVLSPAQVIQDCETAGGNGPTCDAITRPLPFSDRTLANAATRVFTGAINAAALRTRGLDFDLGYSFEAGAATIGMRLTANRVLRYITQGTTTAPRISSAGVIDHSLANVVPKWTGRLDLSLRRGGFEANLSARYIDQLKLGLPPGTPGGFVYAGKKLFAVAYFDAGVSQRVNSGQTEFEVFADIHNLLDKDPPIFPGNNLAGLLYPTAPQLYDVVGRFFTIGVRIRR